MRLRYYDSSLTSEWEVYLSGIPKDGLITSSGREVIVVWKNFEVMNNGTFYTDSNGLEM